MIIILSGSCESNDEQFDIIQSVNIDSLVLKNVSKINIETGIAGTLIKKSGDCMPMINGPNNRCNSYPVSRTILIYNYTKLNQVEGWGPSYNSVNSRLVTKCKSDKDGFFQVSVKPGKYSVFILENDKFYANSQDGEGGIYPVNVSTGITSSIILILNYAVY